METKQRDECAFPWKANGECGLHGPRKIPRGTWTNTEESKDSSRDLVRSMKCALCLQAPAFPLRHVVNKDGHAWHNLMEFH